MSNNDIETLKKIAHKTKTAERVFISWALRTRHRGPIDLTKNKRQLRKEGEAIDDREYREMIEELAKTGYGKLIKNHKGEVTHFRLNHPVYQLGRAAIEGKPLRPTAVPVKPMAIAVSTPTNALVKKTVVYIFSEGRKIRLDVEGDVSEKRLEKVIASFQN